MRKKIYGKSSEQTCVFCEKTALSENTQGFPCCNEHKNKMMHDRLCVCGNHLSIKKSKWGAFFLCPDCGPMSLKKILSLDQPGACFKFNKKFREKQKTANPSNRLSENEYYLSTPLELKKEKIYTMAELEAMWEDK
jgi:predicted RNA-binding Zn-ribbon protein involved in translation (DUF1610 family)